MFSPLSILCYLLPKEGIFRVLEGCFSDNFKEVGLYLAELYFIDVMHFPD